MSLFEELDLKPGDGSAHALKRELELRASRAGRRAEVAAFILRHGETWRGIATPPEYHDHIGSAQRCFLNAMTAALANPDLTYVEGLYNVGGWAAEHAWCVDPQGRLVELTFMDDRAIGEEFVMRDSSTGMVRRTRPELFAYHGVRIGNAALVKRLCDEMDPDGGKWGVLHPENDAPIMRLPLSEWR